MTLAGISQSYRGLSAEKGGPGFRTCWPAGCETFMSHEFVCKKNNPNFSDNFTVQYCRVSTVLVNIGTARINLAVI